MVLFEGAFRAGEGIMFSVQFHGSVSGPAGKERTAPHARLEQKALLVPGLEVTQDPLSPFDQDPTLPPGRSK